MVGSLTIKAVNDRIDDVSPAFLPNEVCDRAKAIYSDYHNATSENVLRNLDLDRIAKASVYLAAQDSNQPLQLNELGNPGGLGRVVKRIRNMTGIHTLPPAPEVFLERYAEELDLKDKTVEKAKEIIELDSWPYQPATIAAAAIYFGSKLTIESLTQREVSISCGVSKVTIRKAYTELRDAYFAAKEIDIYRPEVSDD